VRATSIIAHRQGGRIPFDRWAFLTVPLTDLDLVEAAYIRAHRPPFNRGRRNVNIRPLPGPD